MRKRTKYPNRKYPLACDFKDKLVRKPSLKAQRLSKFQDRFNSGIGREVSVLERKAIFRRWKEMESKYSELTFREELIFPKTNILFGLIPEI